MLLLVLLNDFFTNRYNISSIDKTTIDTSSIDNIIDYTIDTITV